MVYFFITLNALLGVLITYAVHPSIGISILLFDLIMLTFGCNTFIGYYFIAKEKMRWGDKVNKIVYCDKRLLMSIACLTNSLRIATIVMLIIGWIATIAVGLVICLASGILYEVFFEGSKNTTDGCIGSFVVARYLFKLVSFLSSCYDKIAELIAKAELYFLNIDIPK